MREPIFTREIMIKPLIYMTYVKIVNRIFTKVDAPLQAETKGKLRP